MTPTKPSSNSFAKTRNTKTLILGLGNDLRSDDAIGLIVVRELKKQLSQRKDFAFQETCEMGFCLLDYIVGYGGLIIADAIQTEKFPVGHIHAFSEDSLKALCGVSPHATGVGEVLAMGRALDLAMPSKVKIFAIEVGDPFTLSSEMTPELKEALPDIVCKLCKEINHA